MDKGPSTYQVGVLAEESPEWTRMADAVSQQIGTKIEFRKYSDLDAAKKAVTDGEVDMALEPLNPARPYAYRAYQPNQPVLQLAIYCAGNFATSATGRCSPSRVSRQQI